MLRMYTSCQSPKLKLMWVGCGHLQHKKRPAPWFLSPVGGRVLVWWCPGLSREESIRLASWGGSVTCQPHSTLDLQLPMFPNRPLGLV